MEKEERRSWRKWRGGDEEGDGEIREEKIEKEKEVRT